VAFAAAFAFAEIETCSSKSFLQLSRQMAAKEKITKKKNIFFGFCI